VHYARRAWDKGGRVGGGGASLFCSPMFSVTPRGMMRPGGPGVNRSARRTAAATGLANRVALERIHKGTRCKSGCNTNTNKTRNPIEPH